MLASAHIVSYAMTIRRLMMTLMTAAGKGITMDNNKLLLTSFTPKLVGRKNMKEDSKLDRAQTPMM